MTTPAKLALEDGTVFTGISFGAEGEVDGEVCFNTSMTGYQEILTDPSYRGQIVTMTYTEMGNYGVNAEDVESSKPHLAGFIVKEFAERPSNFRAEESLAAYLKRHGIVGLAGIDTRSLVRRLRTGGAMKGVVSTTDLDDVSLVRKAIASPGLVGRDLVREVIPDQPREWDGNLSSWAKLPVEPNPTFSESEFHVVALDYGMKWNIARHLRDEGCRITILPGTATAEDVLSHQPDGVFLSNGPGDPAATGVYAVPAIRSVIQSGTPVFGICLGHQMLGLALGGRTMKMHQGHHGANHPVKNLTTGKVEITSMNHGFAVDKDTLPKNVDQTHISLFDGSNCGLALKDRPVFSVQYHPEASPGPRDSHYLFKRFAGLMKAHKRM